MFYGQKLQLAGPFGVIGAIACAECCSFALACWPSSPLLWYLNLEVFRPVQYSLVAENSVALGGWAQTIYVVVPLLILVIFACIAKAKLPLAIASNLSLLYSALLIYGSYLANRPAAGTGLSMNVVWAPSFFLAVSVLLASFLSSAVSHRAYWRDIFA
jgi:hypothetical protein